MCIYISRGEEEEKREKKSDLEKSGRSRRSCPQECVRREQSRTDRYPHARSQVWKERGTIEMANTRKGASARVRRRLKRWILCSEPTVKNRLCKWGGTERKRKKGKRRERISYHQFRGKKGSLVIKNPLMIHVLVSAKRKEISPPKQAASAKYPSKSLGGGRKRRGPTREMEKGESPFGRRKTLGVETSWSSEKKGEMIHTKKQSDTLSAALDWGTFLPEMGGFEGGKRVGSLV